VQTTANEFVTIAEASKRLGVAPNTLRSWGSHGKIQEYRHPLNNYRLYRLEDLTTMVQILKSPVKVGESTMKMTKKR
jgi:DNA-binding transcriptional MerR regulator